LPRLISPTRRFLRIARRYAAVGFTISACLLDYLFNALSGRSSLIHRASVLHRRSAQLLPRLGVSFRRQGAIPASGLVVSNHLSYLDILVFSAIAPCVFVSKREVRLWPGIGWIASLAGCIYIDRARQQSTQDVQPQMAAALAAGVRVILFAEGTSSDGRQVLPFRSSLFQPAVEGGAPITAACISYEIEDGDPAADVCYYGDHGMGTHSLKLFGKAGVRANVRFGSGAKVFSERKDAARELYEQVSALKDQSAAEVSRDVTAVV
jgi:lyso-ornithine lipid O-acyltransferase